MRVLKTMHQAVGVFGLGKLQDLLTLHDLLARDGLDIEALRDYVGRRIRLVETKGRRHQAGRDRILEANAMRCPACGQVMRLFTVNTGPRDQVGGGFKSQWACPANACMETVFNEQSVEEILAGMGILRPDKPAPAATPQKKRCCNG